MLIKDYGPQLPSTAIRRSSLLTLGQIHEYQVSYFKPSNRSHPWITINEHVITIKMIFP
jgi:hypothetical protein